MLAFPISKFSRQKPVRHGQSWAQCCGAKTICFVSSSGSDFQKVSAPAPAPTQTLWVPVFTAFQWKSRFFSWLLGKNIDLIHFFDPIQHELYYFILTRSREPEQKLQYSGSRSGSGQKFWLLAAPAPAPQHWLGNSFPISDSLIV